MKELTSYNRVAGYLNKMFDLLNAEFFESTLSRPTIAKIGIPAPSACSLGTTLPEFQPHFHALKPQCLIIGLAQPYCD